MTVLIYPLPDKSNAGQDKLLHPIPRAFAEIAYFRSYSDDGSTYDSYLWCFISKKKYVKYCFYSIDCHDRTVEVDLRVISFLRYSSCRQTHGLLAPFASLSSCYISDLVFSTHDTCRRLPLDYG